MANRQRRTGVAMARGIYERVRDEAERDGVSMAAWVDDVVRDELARRNRPYNVRTFKMPRRVVERIAVTKRARRERAAAGVPS